MYIDHSVYPDQNELPTELVSMEAKADYVHRIASAWDFGITPEAETFALFSQWKEVFDKFRIETSPAYHTFREWFGWEKVPIPPGLHFPEPRYIELDRIEGRTDPCEHMV